MSEEAYWAQHRVDYGVSPDEDGQVEHDEEEFTCPKCGDSARVSERGSDGLCCDCSADNARPAQQPGIARPDFCEHIDKDEQGYCLNCGTYVP